MGQTRDGNGVVKAGWPAGDQLSARASVVWWGSAWTGANHVPILMQAREQCGLHPGSFLGPERTDYIHVQKEKARQESRLCASRLKIRPTSEVMSHPIVLRQGLRRVKLLAHIFIRNLVVCTKRGYLEYSQNAKQRNKKRDSDMLLMGK